ATDADAARATDAADAARPTDAADPTRTDAALGDAAGLRAADPAPAPLALPRSGLLFCALSPPVLTALFDPTFFVASAASNVRSLAAVYLYTSLCVALTHALWGAFLSRNFFLLPAGARVWAVLACEAAAVAVCTSAMRPALLTLSPGMVSNLPRLFTQGFVVMTVYLGSGFGYVYWRDRVAHERARAERAGTAALEARLEALQARTNPHFLFNSLNTVMELVASDPVLAEETLARLAAIYRYALEGAERRLVLLQDELDAVRDYLEVERARFGDRLRYRFEVGPGAASIKVPPLLVQPLVENAVLHGIGRRIAGGEVRLSARAEGGGLELVVSNDGPDPGGKAHRGAGTSLRNIAERLRLLYGDAASLTTHRTPGGGYEARLRVRPS
ncbi:MAG TPA: histidine kinase, partial [Polyangiaceae bacterium]|nr:histidine kinase [Polyangiaceae bacterium]